MERQLSIVHITTLHPSTADMLVRIVRQDDELVVIAEGYTNLSGACNLEYLCSEDTEVVLTLTTEGGEEKIHWRGILRTLRNMECFLTNPPKLTQLEIHKRYMAKHAELALKKGMAPDPDQVAREAFRY